MSRDTAPQIKGPACTGCGRTFHVNPLLAGTVKCPWCGFPTKVRKAT